jgi:DNA-binding protein HU-beta
VIKTDLIDAVVEQGLSKKQSTLVVETIFSSITDALQRGEKVQLVGFGTFRTKERKGRMGRNPRTGESVNVPAKRVPLFKAGKVLKEAVK